MKMDPCSALAVILKNRSQRALWPGVEDGWKMSKDRRDIYGRRVYNPG